MSTDSAASSASATQASTQASTAASVTPSIAAPAPTASAAPTTPSATQAAAAASLPTSIAAPPTLSTLSASSTAPTLSSVIMSNAAAQDAADAAAKLAAAASATSTTAATTAMISHSTLPTTHMLSSAAYVPAMYQSAGPQWTTTGAASYLPSQTYMTTLGGQSGAYHYAPLSTSHSYLPSHADYSQLIYSHQIPHTLSIRPGTAMYATTGTGATGTVIGADGEEVEVDSKGMRVIRVKRACSNCKSAKTKCDNERPCRRCTRTGRVASCVDSIHKKRGRKRTGLPGDNEANSDSDTDGDDDGTKRKSDSLTPNKRSKAARNSTDLTDPRFASQFGRIISTPTMNVPIQTIPNSSPAEWLTSFVQHLRANNERWMQLIASYGASLTDPTAQRANQWISKFIDYLSSPEVTTAATNTTTSPTDSTTALTAAATTTTTTTDDKDDKSKLAAAVAASSTASSSSSASVDPNDPVATSMEQSKLVYAQVHIPVLLMSYSPFPFHTSTRPAWANQTFCDILGYTPAEIEQLLKTVHGWSQIYHMVNIPAFVQSFVEAVHRGSASYTVRARFIRKDRTQIELNESASITYQAATNADGTNPSSSGVPLMISLLFHPVDQTAQFATTASSFSPSGARGPILYPSTFYTADPNSFMNFAATSAASLGSMRPATSPTSAAYFTTTSAASAAAAAAAAAAQAGSYTTSQLSASPTSSAYARQIYPTRDNTVALINGSMVLSNSAIPTSASYQPVMMVGDSTTQSAVADPAAAAAAAASYYSTAAAVTATPTKPTEAAAPST